MVSGEVGCRKPQREIFDLAARLGQASLEGAWMVGDHPDSDMRGARGLGLRTAWVSRASSWTALDFVPDVSEPTAVAAITRVLESSTAQGGPRL